MSTEIKTEEQWESKGLGIAGRQLIERNTSGIVDVKQHDLLIYADGDRIIANTNFISSGTSARVYRKIPVAKQGDLDECTDVIHLDKLPVSCSILPSDAAARKALPVYTGVLAYFPDALLAVAHCSKVGNEQHSPGQPLHWDRSKSKDQADALVRHLLQRGTTDTDGVLHSAKTAWRALALLQLEIEATRNAPAPSSAPQEKDA